MQPRYHLRTHPDLLVCERYMLLPNDKKQMIAGELDREVREIERKISVSVSAPCTACFAQLSRIYAIA